MRATPFAALACCLALAGCGAPPWQQQGATAEPTPAVSSAASTPSSAPSRPAQTNDLAKGSLARTLGAGNAEVKIKYYSTLDLAQWTPSATKPLNVSASARFTDDSKQDIYLTEVKVAVDALDADGKATPLDPLVDKADVSPGFVITSPASYGQVFSIPAVPDTTTAVSLTVTYQLLVQVAPDVKRYSRQAAVDRLQITLAS